MKFYLSPVLCLLAMTVSSCGDFTDTVYEKYTGERRGDVVAGARRPPMLNPGGIRRAALDIEIPAAMPPHVTPKMLTPYDQYDETGPVSNAPKEIRKKFSGKRTTETVEEAPPAERSDKVTMPLAPATPIVNNLAPEVNTRVVPISPRIRIEEPEMPTEDNGVMVPLPEQRSGLPAQKIFAALEPAAGGSAPDRPHLSEVPREPDVLRVIQEEKESARKALEDEHDKAMENKKHIEEEPTDLPTVTLPQVQGMLNDIKHAIEGRKPIVTAENHSS